jgi:hypothetical protein
MNTYHPLETTDSMVDTLVRQEQQSNHIGDLMEVTREVVIQQLSSIAVNKLELDRLCNSINDRLVLNLSSSNLTEEEVRFLKLGVGFRPVLIRKLQEAEIVRAAESATARLGRTLRIALDSQGDEPRSAVPRHNLFNQEYQSGLHSCLSRVFRRFSGAILEESDYQLSEVDVVTGQHLKLFRDNLLMELRDADRLYPSNLDPALTAAFRHLKQLVNCRQVVIRKADKSRQICVLDPEKYDSSVRAQLSDTASYQPTAFNMKRKCAALIIQCVRAFTDKKLLTEKQAKTLLLYTGNPASRCFYGLPKTHKPADKWTNGMPPLRPICPDIRTETAVTACLLAQYLTPLLDSIKSYFKNSYVLKDRLLRTNILGPTTILLTADVESLYPSIPIQPALHRVVRRLNNKAPEFQFIVQLLRIQLAHNYFEFQGQSYKQIKGLPMGKAWAPVVASIYMDEWERSLWHLLGFEPIIYVRYIDDIFAVFKNQEDAERFVHAAASHDKHIRLSDVSIGSSVHFLDLQIAINGHGRFDTSLYRKESDLIVLLHQQSSHSRGIKDGVILSQLQRLLRLHTNYTEAGRCMFVFMKAMVRHRGLSPRRARRLWNAFLNKIRSGAIHIGYYRPEGMTHAVQPSPRDYRRSVCVTIPPAVRRRRVCALVDNLRDRFSGPQRRALHNIRLENMRSTPIGVLLFRH